MTRIFRFTDDTKEAVTVDSGPDAGTFIPSVSRFMHEWGINEAIADGAVLFPIYETDEKLNTSDEFQVKGEIVITPDPDNFREIHKQTYVLKPLAELMELKLEQLKAMRKEMVDAGFVYKGARCISDRDAQSDVLILDTKYNRGQIPDSFIYEYKIGPGVYMELNVKAGGGTTISGKEGMEHFSNAMSVFVNTECFGKEKILSKTILGYKTPKEIVDLDLDVAYRPDISTDYATL